MAVSFAWRQPSVLLPVCVLAIVGCLSLSAMTVFARDSADADVTAAALDRGDSCPTEGCSAALRRSRAPCLLDDAVCLGLSPSAMPKKGVVKPRKALSSSKTFYRERAQRHFQQALQWLHEHQFPCDCSKASIFALEHPHGDGDGYATRLGRLATRIVPRLLEGDVFVVSGGFRGYTDTDLCGDRGLECVYRPMSSCLPDGGQRDSPVCNSMSARSSGKPPQHLLKHGTAWWFGVLLYFMQRPNEDLIAYVREHVEPLPYVPLLEPHHGAIPPEDEAGSCYIGVQIRKGDKNEARPFKDKDYTEQVDFMASELMGHNLLRPHEGTGGKALAFLATDDKKTAKRLRKKAKTGFEHVQFVMLNSSATRGIGKPGRSVANYLLRKSADAEKQYRMTMEIATDTILLSNACGLVGLASSKITLVAAYAGTVSGRLLTQPIAVDARNEYHVRPAKPSTDERTLQSLWNAPLPPFLDTCCGSM